MPDEEQAERDIERKRAKKVTGAKKGHAIDGRLGIIIDGTGKDYDKMIRQVVHLQELGYETSMVFVNTTLETALERNRKRDRSVPPEIAKGWKDVQKNLPRFQRYFRNRFFVADNNTGDDLRPITKAVRRAILKR